MTRQMRQWLRRKWGRDLDPGLAEAYRMTFSGLHGEQVLAHLMDSIYCRAYDGHDPMEAATFNGRRLVVHEILENIDLGAHPHRDDGQEDSVYAT